MYVFVLTNDSLYGLSWYDENDLKKVSDTFYHRFEKPLLSYIADDQQLANFIGGILSQIAEDHDFAGEKIHLYLDETLVFEEIVILHDDLDESELQQYFTKKKQWLLGKGSNHYSFSWVANPEIDNEYFVAYLPAGLPDALKLSLRELGARPGKLLCTGLPAFKPGEEQVRQTVFESVRGYTVYGYTVRGNFITDMKFLSGLPKYSNWTGDTSLQEHIFTDEMAEIDSSVSFVGTFTENQKSRWTESCGYTENLLSDFAVPEKARLSQDQVSLCHWLIANISGSLPSLYDTNRLYYATEEPEPEITVAKQPEPRKEKPVTETKGNNSRYHSLIVALFLVTSLLYIVTNRNLIREWRYWGYEATVAKTEKIIPLPDSAREWITDSRNYLYLLHEIVSNPKLQNFDKVVISADELELLYPDTVQAQSILGEVLNNIPLPNPTGDRGQYITPRQWRAQFLKLFPGGSIDMYRAITKRDFKYSPATIRVTGLPEITGCLLWLQQGATNVAVRKAELLHNDMSYTIRLYIAVLSGV